MSQYQPLKPDQALPEMELQLDSETARQFEKASDETNVTALEIDNEQRSLAEQVWERREAPRRHQEEKGLRGRLRREINHLVTLVESSWRGWFALISLFILSCALLYWSATIRKDLIKEHTILSSQLEEQQFELDDLLQRWSQGELKTLKERVQSAESRVFPDYQRLAWWLNRQALIADQLNLIMQYNLTAAIPTQIKDVGEVSIKIKVIAKPEHAQHSYLRMLEFIHGLVGDQWHLEISNTLVQSNGAGVTNMNVSIHIWVHDENIEIVGQ